MLIKQLILIPYLNFKHLMQLIMLNPLLQITSIILYQQIKHYHFYLLFMFMKKFI